MIHNGRFKKLGRTTRNLGISLALLLPVLGRAQSPAGIVRGKVTSADNQEALAGVQVFIPGTPLGTVTDENGKYVLRNVGPGSIQLKTRVIGFNSATQTVNVGAGADIAADFRLTRSALQLDQVVVTGTPGATEKRAVGNAIATVDAASIVPSSPSTDISGLLNARAAGVTTLSQSGLIGAGSAIRIRGAGSISLSNAPLIYVDGVRLDNTSGSILAAGTAGTAARIDDINPEDIESIEIIKGPAAATLYGTEASNGVIQIITKKGVSGATNVTAQLRTGVNYLPNASTIFPLNWFINSSGVPVSQNLVETEAAAGRDIFRTGNLKEFELQSDGGNETAKYFLSGGYLANQGIYTNNYLHRFTTRANVNAALSKTLNIQGTAAYVESTNPQMPEAASATFGVMPMLLFGSPVSAATRLRGFLRATPEASETIRQDEDINRTTLGLSATYTPALWLTSRVNTGLDWVRQNDNTLYPFDPNGFFGALSNGNKTVNEFTRRNITLDWAGTAKYSTANDAILASSIGLQYYDKTASLVSGTSQNFPSPGLETLSSGSVTTSGETFVENKTLGGYVQEELSSRNRRFLTVALRGDANSAFGQTYKPAYYPKISGAWVVSEEGLPIPSFVSQLRLRGAYGLSGLQPDALAAVRTYTPVAGTGGQAAILPLGPGNRTIRPERANELELGFDLDMFSGRTGAVFTYFNKKTTDAIVAVPSAPSTGFPGSEFQNLGRVTNKGYELEVNTTPVLRQRFQWDIGGTLTRVTNLVNSLGGSPTINTGQGFNTILIKEGYPIGSFFAKKVVSADRTATNTATNLLCDGGPDVNNAAVACGTAPAVFLADPGPGWELGLRSSLHLGSRLTLGGLVDGQLDTHMFSSMLFARDAAFRNSYNATHPAEESIIEIADISIGSDAPFIINNSFMRLRELSANYILPTSFTRKLMGSRSATFGFAVRNLGFLYRNPETKGVDPEGSVGQVSWVHFEQALTPQLRTFVVSLRVTH
jgi:TonB-linked SusC/RagA family outer membrane protein